MAGIIHTGVRAPDSQTRESFPLRWTGIFSFLPVRFVARMAVRREILRKGNAIARTFGVVLDLPLGRLSRNPLYCVRVRHEFLRELRLRKNFSPGWRKACFDASGRRFGPLV